METKIEDPLPCPTLGINGMHLPPAPERPLDSDCCGEGCTPCIMDIYQEELDLWQEECEHIKQGSSLHKQERLKVCEVTTLCPTKYSKYLIASISQEATDILRIRCQLSRGVSLGLSLGQHIIIRFSDTNGSTTTRQYTPTSPLTATGYFELMIKIYPDGRASQQVRLWKVGDQIEARGPAGHFPYQPNTYKLLLMLCAGTGVAPMCQVTQAILEDDRDESRLRLVYAAQDYSCLMARQEIEEWQRYWNFSCLFLLSQEPDKPAWKYKHGEDVRRGRLGLELIKSEIGSCHLDQVLVLVCGTRAYDTNVLACLQELGVPDSSIHRF